MKQITLKKHTVACLAVILMIVPSCKKGWLNPNPQSFLSPDNSYNTKEGIQSLLVRCSEGLRLEFMGRGCRVNIDYLASDMGVQVNGSPRDFVTELLPSTGLVKQLWDDQYQEINYANTVISSSKILNAPDATKNESLSEGYFYLGYWYYKLINTWGDVPLITEEITQPKLDFHTSTKRKIIKTMIANLEFAIQYLPQDAPNGSTNLGAAEQLLSKYYLQAGRFQDAVNMTTRIISNSKYALMKRRFGSDAADATKNVMWDLFHKYNASAATNTEKIMVVQDYPGISGGTSGSERMREFLTEWYKNNNDTKGKPGTIDGLDGEPQISFTGRGIGKSKKTVYFAYTLWKDKNDLRHNAPNWLPMEALLYNKKGTANYGQPLVRARCVDTLRGYDDIVFNKIVVDDEFKPKGQGLNILGGTMDWYVYRLAETYLLRAEAYVWLTGHDKEAADDINAIRVRAGASPIPATSVSIDDVLDERARELFIEEFRKIELTRISYIMASLNKNGYTLNNIYLKNYYYDRMMAKNQFYKTQMLYNTKQYHIEPYHIYWPVPQSVIQDNTLYRINQNYGYVGYEKNVTPED
ncbi:RagB/SusD family nutrient uptake outer membrane protein [Mucilaginibacter sp.]|uniref:RagB/SusD family nutrient uptake outer membrane protein n=1 Tax=Mucilaginibacter sp. TaxID=1882438 RepID=UPI0026037D45|nr:RagB/SusD family nutrient uptake outer membrane protein [Mucilaginibacter sp.]MDB4923071.1 RagB/SusD family nutrient uptake outer membrane protein [Mucilaginibacter sp.]